MSLRLGSPTITFLHNALNVSLPVKGANRGHELAHTNILLLKGNCEIVENIELFLCGQNSNKQS
jgi:hypothetical protein